VATTIVPATSKKDSSKRDIDKEARDLLKVRQSDTDVHPTKACKAVATIDGIEAVSTLDKNEKPVQSTAYWVEMYAAVTRWGVTYTFNEDTRLFELDCPQRLPSTPSEPD
jgi:hypothetical protein